MSKRVDSEDSDLLSQQTVITIRFFYIKHESRGISLSLVSVSATEIASECVGWKEHLVFSGLPKHVQVLSPCQTVNHLCDTLEVPQPVSLLWLTDYVCQACQAPDSHGASVCAPNEVLHSKTSSLDDTVTYSEQTDSHHSLNCLSRTSKQKSPLSVYRLFSVSLRKQRDIKVESPRCGASTRKWSIKGKEQLILLLFCN